MMGAAMNSTRIQTPIKAEVASVSPPLVKLIWFQTNNTKMMQIERLAVASQIPAIAIPAPAEREVPTGGAVSFVVVIDNSLIYRRTTRSIQRDTAHTIKYLREKVNMLLD